MGTERMNWFKFRAYVWHRRKAKGRHGTHSPFVYQFIERVVFPTPPVRSWTPLPYIGSGGEPGTWWTTELMRHAMYYFNFKRIVQFYADNLSGDGGLIMEKDDFAEIELVDFPRCARRFNTLYHFNIFGGHPVQPEYWVSQVKGIAPKMEESDIVAVHDLYASPAHSAAWHTLRYLPEVTLSIDLFHTGLLFFSKDFKERQHFVLKYPV